MLAVREVPRSPGKVPRSDPEVPRSFSCLSPAVLNPRCHATPSPPQPPKLPRSPGKVPRSVLVLPRSSLSRRPIRASLGLAVLYPRCHATPSPPQPPKLPRCLGSPFCRQAERSEGSRPQRGRPKGAPAAVSPLSRTAAVSFRSAALATLERSDRRCFAAILQPRSAAMLRAKRPRSV